MAMISFTPADVDRFLSEDDGEPVIMLNLLRFRSHVGRERYIEYLNLARPLVERYGAEIVFAGMIADPDYHAADQVRVSALTEALLQPLRSLSV